MRLAILAIVLAGGCYEPSLQNCTVTCGSADPCAHDQVCGAEGFCVAATGDRCTPAIDAAPPTYALHVMVMGHGAVQITGGATCMADCVYKLPVDESVTAIEIESGGHNFQMWTTPNCAGKNQACTFTLSAAQSLGAKFE